MEPLIKTMADICRYMCISLYILFSILNYLVSYSPDVHKCFTGYFLSTNILLYNHRIIIKIRKLTWI